MFGHRTPDPKHATIPKDAAKLREELKTVTERAGPSFTSDNQPSKVRLSVGEIEARSSLSPPRISASQPAAGTSKTASSPTHSASRTGSRSTGMVATAINAEKSPTPKYQNRTAEAKAWLMKAKLNLGYSRNLKSDIKNEVTEAVQRLYMLVKEAEEEIGGKKKQEKYKGKEREVPSIKTEEILEKIEEHSKLLKENKQEMERLTATLQAQQERHDNRSTYASVAAGSSRRQRPEATAMHSIIVTSKDEHETGDQVYERLRTVVNAKEEGSRIDRVRKARDRKVIVGCRSAEELKKVKQKIVEKEGLLAVEDVKNKDPLIVMYSVLNSNTDEDIIRAIRVQNKHILRDLKEEDDRIEIRFRRKARNPLTSHVVARVSPRIWQCITTAEALHIDMQRIRVADQSPLVQCSRCLGYGHGKRFCPDAVDVCSHCGGAHLKTECPDFLTDTPPSCVNCIKAKAPRADHNAFSNDCPVRRKWDALARSTVAYC